MSLWSPTCPSQKLEAKLPEITGALLVVMAKIMDKVDSNDRAVDHATISNFSSGLAG